MVTFVTNKISSFVTFVRGDVIFSGYVSHSNDSAVVVLNSLFENMFLSMKFYCSGGEGWVCYVCGKVKGF